MQFHYEIIYLSFIFHVFFSLFNTKVSLHCGNCGDLKCVGVISTQTTVRTIHSYEEFYLVFSH